ncbi:SRPBCC family protein [Novosphingobium sp.]|uniref:SRPBCC family protein n=1 Tax=Novosphingobium sp. TaxID=1874826 RepID=UPI0031DA55B6
MNTDRIEKQIILRATRERVWQAISDSAQFGIWFGVEFDGPFVAGQAMIGRIVPTQVDPDVARLQEPHRGTAFRIVVERIEPMEAFAFRWHPFAIDLAYDYEAEPMTLVTFGLSDVEDGVLLSITETGFDRLPMARRAQAWQANDGGWQHQTRLIERYLALEARQG